jgi:hypothetical protein
VEALYIAIVVVAVVAASGILIIRQRTSIRVLAERLHAQESRRTKLEDEITVLLDCTRGIGDRLQKHQSQLKDLQDLNKQRTTEKAQAATPYQQAQDLFKAGSNIKEVVAACKISRGDAEFIQHLAELRAQPQDDLVSLPELLRERENSAAEEREKLFARESRRVSEVPVRH